MKQFIKAILIHIYRLFTDLVPVNKKIILFQSSNGRNYTGNPRYIYEKMVEEGLDQQKDSQAESSSDQDAGSSDKTETEDSEADSSTEETGAADTESYIQCFAAY